MPALSTNRMRRLADYLAQIGTCLSAADQEHLRRVENKLYQVVADLPLAADGSSAALERLQQESKRSPE